jgi:hypothetical protein
VPWSTNNGKGYWCRGSSPYLFGNYSHDEFVGGSRDEKSDEHGARARELVRNYGRGVDMSQQEIMDRFVPLAGEFIPGRRVPLREGHVSTW